MEARSYLLPSWNLQRDICVHNEMRGAYSRITARNAHARWYLFNNSFVSRVLNLPMVNVVALRNPTLGTAKDGHPQEVILLSNKKIIFYKTIKLYFLLLLRLRPQALGGSLLT